MCNKNPGSPWHKNSTDRFAYSQFFNNAKLASNRVVYLDVWSIVYKEIPKKSAYRQPFLQYFAQNKSSDVGDVTRPRILQTAPAGIHDTVDASAPMED